MKKALSEDSRRIRIFLLIEFLLVGFISIPLLLLKAESGSGLVMAASVVFMWLPALATLITRKLTDDKSKLPLKPLIKKNWKMYVVSAYIPSIAVVLGASLYFAFFPKHLDLSFTFLGDLFAAHGQQIQLPTLSIFSLLLLAAGLVILAPLVFINHILAFGEEVGWRGYLLPIMCRKFGVTRGIILDGVLMEDNLRKILWVRCPRCKHKTRLKVYEETVLLYFPLYCPKCKQETVVNIVKLKMVINKEPDA